MLTLSNGNGGEPMPHSYIEVGLTQTDRDILLKLHAELDRVGELLLDARGKHEAEVARRAAEERPSQMSRDSDEYMRQLREK